MTDKVQKIREEVERLRNLHQMKYQQLDINDIMCFVECSKRNLCDKLLSFIDSLQEEPVNIWHDASEMPKEKKVCLIRYSANDGASTNNFEVVIAEPLTRRFVTRSYPHKTGYQHTIHGENTIKVDEYQDRREYIPFSDINEWAYIDDLLNLSNVERTVKDWKEPVSEKKCMFTKDNYTDEDRMVLCEDCDEECEYSKKEEPVSEDTMTIRKEWFEHCKESWYNEGYIDGKYNRDRQFKEPVSEELEQAAVEAFKQIVDDERNSFLEIFKAGAKWQIAKLMANATEVTVHIDAGGYPYIPQIELYDYDKDIPLAKEGDRYKVILIKEK